MDASDIVIYVSQKAQTVPGHGKATPVTVCAFWHTYMIVSLASIW